MAGKRTKVLSPDHVEDLRVFAAQTRHPRVLVRLSFKAGIAKLTWPMVIDPIGEVSTCLELRNRIAKNDSGRVTAVHPELHAALVKSLATN